MAELHASATSFDYFVAKTKRNPRPLPWTLLLALGDALAILAIPLAGSLLRQSTENLPRNLVFWSLLTLITLALTASHGGYAPRPPAASRQAMIVINAFLATSLAMLAMAALFDHPTILFRRWTAFDLGLTPMMLYAMRNGLGALAATAPPAPVPGRTLIVCYDHCPPDLRAALAAQHLAGEIAGVLYLAALREAASPHGWPELPDTLPNIPMDQVQDVVFVHHPALEGFGSARQQELLQELLAYPARIWLALDLSANLPAWLQARSRSCRLIPVVSDDLVTSRNPVKRGFDVVIASALLLLLSPLIAAIALAVRLSGPGPVVFRQTRIGAHGQRFTVLKFRTMHDRPGAFAQARRGDARITKLGRLLRASSLDELLQLVNVVRGEMSLVGPRPHAPETKVEGISFEDALKLYRLRHRVKPGITGLAQIRGQRGETPRLSTLEGRLASDLEYIQGWSLWLDISILLRTLPVLLGHANAH